jgi:hypothetical protein
MTKPKPLNAHKTTAKSLLSLDEPLTPEEITALKRRRNLGSGSWDGPPYRQIDQCTLCRGEIVWWWYDMEALRRDRTPTKIAYNRKYFCYKCKAERWNRYKADRQLTNWWDSRRKSLNGKGTTNGSQ